MATLHRAVASLRITGDQLDPIEVTSALGAAPSQSYRKGDLLTSKHGASRVAPTGFWSIGAGESSPADLDSQVVGLLSELASDANVWRSLASRFEIDLFCGWFMQVMNEGTSLRAESALGSRGLTCTTEQTTSSKLAWAMLRFCATDGRVIPPRTARLALVQSRLTRHRA